MRTLLILVIVLFCLFIALKENKQKGEETTQYNFSEKNNELVSVNIRPTNFVLNIPRNHLTSITHPYMPWAKEVWDMVHVQALLPELNFANNTNFEKFEIDTPSEILRMRIGFLSTDETFLSVTVNGIYEELWTQSDYKLKSFVNRRKYGSQTEESIRKRSPSVFVVDPTYRVTPSGNPIIINCKIGRCYVRVVIPIPKRPQEKQIGLGLEYDYNPKYIKDWEKIHSFVLSTLKSYVNYPENVL